MLRSGFTLDTCRYLVTPVLLTAAALASRFPTGTGYFDHRPFQHLFVRQNGFFCGPPSGGQPDNLLPNVADSSF